jgi:hypothetical protein
MENASPITAQQLSDFVIEFFNHHMPFNQLLGFEVSKIGADKAEISLAWDDKLMVQPHTKNLTWWGDSRNTRYGGQRCSSVIWHKKPR